MLTSDLFSSFKDRTVAITTDDDVIKYCDLADFSQKMGNAVKERCLVFCLCENYAGSLFGYTSFIANRIVPLLLDSNLEQELLEGLMETYKPQYVWLPDNRLSDFPCKQKILTYKNYSLLKLKFDKAFSLHHDLALLFTTSGSTGSPKLVRISYENLYSNASSIAEYLDINENERPITTLPMNYSYGLSIINSHILKGATILLTNNSLIEKGFWSFFKEKKATSFGGVPYTYEILKKFGFFKMDLPDLKTITQAGGKLNFDLNREFAEYFAKKKKRFFVMYGQTEATARMAYLPSEFAVSKIGSMGNAIPGGEFFLVDDSRQIILENEVIGELVYKGKNVSMGYSECGEDLKKEDENNGILYTDDLARRDEDGFYYIVGRKKRFIKIYGNRVNLDETERLLKNIITDCACVGEDDHMIIFVSDEAKKDEIRKYISAKTGINHAAFSVRYIEAIPKNPSGKTIYSKLEIK